MAGNKKISELDPAANLTGNENVELLQVGKNVRQTLTAIKEWILSTLEFKKIDFIPQTPTEQPHLLGRLFYDSTENTWTAYNDIEGISLQIGEELRARLINDTGVTLLNGKAVSIIGLVGDSAKVELLDTSKLDSSIRAYGLMTIDTLNGEPGYAISNGLVRDVDTSLLAEGDVVYGDPFNVGELTTTRPLAPYYPVRVGECLISDAISGAIGVDMLAFNGTDTTVNIEGALNGVVTDVPQVVFSVDTGVIYADITNQAHPTRDLPFIIDDYRYLLNTTTNTGTGGAARVIVPPGASDILKQTSLIYIYLDGGVPTLGISTSLPALATANISYQACFNATRTVTDGQVFAYRRQNNVPDRNDGVHDGGLGVFEEIFFKIRSTLGSNWITGQDGTPTVNNTTIKLALSAGLAAQFRRTNVPLFDGNKYFIYNTIANEITYEDSINLTDIVTDANGNTLVANGRYYTIRLFYQLNSNGLGNFVIATRPLSSYTSPEEAIQDPNNFNVTINDTDIEEIVYPLYDLVIGRTGGGGSTISLIQLTDRRTKMVGGAGGGGASGGGGANDLIRVSANDTTNDYLNPKITAGTGITTTILNPGANEQLEISADGGGITKTSNTITSAATITPIVGTAFNDYFVTAQGEDGAVAAPTGTATNGDRLTIRILGADFYSLTWNAIYRELANSEGLPSYIYATGPHYAYFIYNSQETKWDLTHANWVVA